MTLRYLRLKIVQTMSSFERLRQKLANQEALDARRRAREHASMLAEAEKQDLHNLRKSQARSFRDESKLEEILANFAQLVGGRFSFTYIPRIDGVSLGQGDSDYGFVVWGKRISDTSATSISYTEKCFVVEVTPFGNIRTHRPFSILGKGVTPEIWRKDPKAIERELEKGHGNPHTYRGRDTAPSRGEGW